MLKYAVHRKLKHLIECGSLAKSSVRLLSAKPFYYQELFEHAKPLDTPYKKLTGERKYYIKNCNRNQRKRDRSMCTLLCALVN